MLRGLGYGGWARCVGCGQTGGTSSKEMDSTAQTVAIVGVAAAAVKAIATDPGFKEMGREIAETSRKTRDEFKRKRQSSGDDRPYQHSERDVNDLLSTMPKEKKKEKRKPFPRNPGYEAAIQIENELSPEAKHFSSGGGSGDSSSATGIPLEGSADLSALNSSETPEARSTDEAGEEKAPEIFKTRFKTTKGYFTIEVTRSWAPLGADRFYNLVKAGFFTEIAFYRVISGFMVQFGVHGDPAVSAKWRKAYLPDDPVAQSNKRGYIAYAAAGPGTRTTQFFINLVDNPRLDATGSAPFGKVVENMKVVDSLYSGYGELSPSGNGPDWGRLQTEGTVYLDHNFPKVDYIMNAVLLPSQSEGADAKSHKDEVDSVEKAMQMTDLLGK